MNQESSPAHSAMNPDFPVGKIRVRNHDFDFSLSRSQKAWSDLVLEISLALAPEKRADRGKREFRRPSENFLMEIFG
jgi:hypothetical protein